VGKSHFLNGEFFAVEEVEQIVDVVRIGIDGVLRVVALQTQKAYVVALYLNIIYDIVLRCCCVES
jgi:hypothetical protein